jgi:hypothetical protein
VNRGRVLRTLLLFEAPTDQLNYVVQIEADTPVLVLQEDAENAAVRVLTPDGDTGWTEAGLVRADYGVTQEDEVTLYNWPDARKGQITGTLTINAPVFVKDTLDGWYRVESTDGTTGWAPADAFAMSDTIAQGYIDCPTRNWPMCAACPQLTRWPSPPSTTTTA